VAPSLKRKRSIVSNLQPGARRWNQKSAEEVLNDGRPDGVMEDDAEESQFLGLLTGYVYSDYSNSAFKQQEAFARTLLLLTKPLKAPGRRTISVSHGIP
jgi:hypothetical protein